MAGLVGAGPQRGLHGHLTACCPIKTGTVSTSTARKLNARSDREDAVRSVASSMVSEDQQGLRPEFRMGHSSTNIADFQPRARLRTGALVSVKKERLAARVGRSTSDGSARQGAHDAHQGGARCRGGNQQKVVIARSPEHGAARSSFWTSRRRASTSAAKNDIYNIINQMAAAGAAVIMISSELPELMGMSDRYVVMAEGRVRSAS